MALVLRELAGAAEARGLMLGHIQTILPALWPSEESVAWSRTRWSTPDCDFIDLDWHTASETPAHTPLMALFHGLEGSSRSPYALALARAAQHKGWTTVVVHFRGCSGVINQQPRAYHAGDVAEIDWILQRLAREHPGPLVATGVSLGGNALMLWLARGGSANVPRLAAAAALSAPLDLSAAGTAIDRGINRLLYARFFLETMRRKARAKHEQFPGLFDLDRVLRATTLRDFDDAFTAPIHGFAGVEQYWTTCSCARELGSIDLPTLLVNPENDPLVPIASLPDPAELMRASSGRVQAVRPIRGGHVGFIGRRAASIVDWLGTHLHQR
jgi:uncharacterized protein